jgi:LacI family transcriptional regulator
VPKSKRIALALPLGVPHLEEVVHGIRLYAQREADWDFVTSPETHSIPVSTLAGWDGDGVIGMVHTAEDLRVVRRLACPIINLSGALADSGVPRVRVDYHRAGRMAAEHLLSRGFDRFAYYGLREVFYARACLEGFRDEIQAHGGQCAVYEDDSTIGVARPWQHDHESLAAWLKALSLPVAVMASHDPRAILVVQACRRIGLRVPEDVAVIGFNNDLQGCEFCDPPLTSISRPGEKIGAEAAALLDRLMRGGRPPENDIIVPPTEVIERASTDTLAVDDDPEFARAIQFIRQNLSRPLGVDDILKQISMSRRWLESMFRKKLKTTPLAYITQVRVKKARRLLADLPKLRLKEVARQCGFGGTRQLNLAFERVLGTTPRQFVGKPEAR